MRYTIAHSLGDYLKFSRAARLCAVLLAGFSGRQTTLKRVYVNSVAGLECILFLLYNVKNVHGYTFPLKLSYLVSFRMGFKRGKLAAHEISRHWRGHVGRVDGIIRNVPARWSDTTMHKARTMYARQWAATMV